MTISMLAAHVRCTVCFESHPVPMDAVRDTSQVVDHLPSSWEVGQTDSYHWVACSKECAKKVTPELVHQRYEERVAYLMNKGKHPMIDPTNEEEDAYIWRTPRSFRPKG